MTGAPVKYVAKSLWKKIQKLSACNIVITCMINRKLYAHYNIYKSTT